MIKTDIPGYTYGTDAVPRSPVSLDELELLQATLLLGENDRAALRRSSDILAPQSMPSSTSGTASLVPTPTYSPRSPTLTANPTRCIWRPYDAGSASGSSTPPGQNSIRLGLTTNTRSAYATPAGARTTPTAFRPPTMFRCGMSSHC
jgi:hypothetical protein